MSGEQHPPAADALAAWVEQVWQARREREPQADAPAVSDNGDGKGRAGMAGDTGGKSRRDALKQQAGKWLEEGRVLVDVLQKLLDENAQLRARASQLEEQHAQLQTKAAEMEREFLRLLEEGARSAPKQPEVVELTPRGGLDMSSAAALKLPDYLQAGKAKILLDLAGVDYIDSSGLGEIVRAMKRARQAGGDVRLCNLQQDVLQIFQVTGLNKAILIYPTREEALASWAA